MSAEEQVELLQGWEEVAAHIGHSNQSMSTSVVTAVESSSRKYVATLIGRDAHCRSVAGSRYHHLLSQAQSVVVSNWLRHYLWRRAH